MNRKILQDIKVKREKISIKPENFFVPEKKEEINIPIEKEKYKSGETSLQDIFNEIFAENKKKEFIVENKTKRISRNPHLPRKKRTIGILFSRILLLSLFLGIIFLGSLLFEKVSITITKKHQIFNLENESFIGLKELDSKVPFEIMIVSDQKSENINFSEGKEVSLKAQGEIVLYNEYSKTPEKLVVNTYISDENGKVYLLDKGVSIPGYTEKEGKIIPGEVIVSATSFLPGESYNGNLTSFTINAYKNTPKFKKIYGKSTKDFSGGAIGLYYSLNKKDIENLKNIALNNLKESLIKKVDSLIPKEYIFYPSAYNFSYKINENTLSPTMNGKVDISGVLSVVILKEKELKEEIIRNKITKITEKELQSIEIQGMDKLVFGFVDSNQTITKDLNSISFYLKGILDFIWNPDVASLRNNLFNTPRENIETIFKNDIGVGNTDVKIFPPWKKTLPSDKSKIKIEVI